MQIDPSKMEEEKPKVIEENQLFAQNVLRRLTTQFLEEILTKAQHSCPK